MSAENVLNNNNQSITNYDATTLFLGDNHYVQGTGFTSELSVQEWPIGQVMGRIASTGKLTVCTSGASDGSQIPLGILTEGISISAGATPTISVCVSGQVNEGGVVADSGDDLDTDYNGQILRDRLAGGTLGIRLIATDDLSGYDNQ